MEKDLDLLTLLKQVELIQEGKGQSLSLKTARLIQALFDKNSSTSGTESKTMSQQQE